MGQNPAGVIRHLDPVRLAPQQVTAQGTSKNVLKICLIFLAAENHYTAVLFTLQYDRTRVMFLNRRLWQWWVVHLHRCVLLVLFISRCWNNEKQKIKIFNGKQRVRQLITIKITQEWTQQLKQRRMEEEQRCRNDRWRSRDVKIMKMEV